MVNIDLTTIPLPDVSCDVIRLSATYDYEAFMGQFFSRNDQSNPQMYNWNHVFFQYCDGSMYSGDVKGPVTSPSSSSKTLYFNGLGVHQALMKDLMVNRGERLIQQGIIDGQAVISEMTCLCLTMTLVLHVLSFSV